MDKTIILEQLKSWFDLEPLQSRVLVVGLGSTGVSAARYLLDLGFKFAVTDSRNKPPLLDEFI